MKKIRGQSWLFSNCFFIFFSLYLFVKFIFILFFTAAYEPRFIFEFTPCYLLSGVTDVQLLVLALVVMISDLYCHLQSGRRQLLLSFIPTAIMVSGVGSSIMTNQMGLAFVYHYAIFGCLLLVVLIDYNYVLSGQNYPMGLRKKEQPLGKALGPYDASVRAKKFDVSSQRLSTLPPGTISELKGISDAFLQRMEAALESLERTTTRLEALEHAVGDEQKHILDHEHVFNDRVLYNLETLQKIPAHVTHHKQSDAVVTKKDENKRLQHPSIDQNTNDFIVIVKRGRIKEISSAFAEFLGYQPVELLEKNFFTYVSPQALEDARKFYVDRLKGTLLDSFHTSLLNKEQQELLVNITVTPAIYEGETAEFLRIFVIPDKTLFAMSMSNT